MVRGLIVLAVVAIALIVYALVDVLYTRRERVRALPKPVWFVIVVLLPVVGALMWFFLGKARGLGWEVRGQAERSAGESTGRSAGRGGVGRGAGRGAGRSAGRVRPGAGGEDSVASAEDSVLRDLEERMRELDREVFPGEAAPSPGETAALPDEGAASPGETEEGASGKS